jgi:CopG family nickel-responsive transcriptional regulator
MEVTILRGKTGKVRKFAEHVIAERGVRHGRVMLVPTDVLAKPDAPGHEAPHPHPHRHAGPRPRRSA